MVAAQFNLARMYEEGRGTPVDIIEAAHWYRQAAEKGTRRAVSMGPSA